MLGRLMLNNLMRRSIKMPGFTPRALRLVNRHGMRPPPTYETILGDPESSEQAIQLLTGDQVTTLPNYQKYFHLK